MKRLPIAAILAMSIVGSWALVAGPAAAAEEARPISTAQLQKILKFVDTIGAKEEFPPPTAQNLGVTSDPNQPLPVSVVVTDDHQVYFCRSNLNPADYIIWTRTSDKDSSYMFLTHADLKLVRALHLRNNGFPDVLEVPSAQVQTMYKDALVALGKDVDHAAATH
jgi:hypothetical protein